MLALLRWTEETLGKVLLAAIVLLVFVAAIARTIDHPVIWSVDLAQALFVWLCFTGAVKALGRRAHIGVDYFVQKLPYGARRGIDLCLAVLAVAFLSTMTWFGMQLTLLNWQRVYGDSGISYAWVTIAVPIGCGFLAVVILAQIVIALRHRTLVFGKHDSAPQPEPHGKAAEDLVQQEL